MAALAQFNIPLAYINCAKIYQIISLQTYPRPPHISIYMFLYIFILTIFKIIIISSYNITSYITLSGWCEIIPCHNTGLATGRVLQLDVFSTMFTADNVKPILQATYSNLPLNTPNKTGYSCVNQMMKNTNLNKNILGMFITTCHTIHNIYLSFRI